MAQNSAVEAFWQEYLASLPEGSEKPSEYQAWHFASTPQAANELGRLTLEGIKTATASLGWAYEAEHEPLPEPGLINLITDWEGQPLCIVETSAVQILPFHQVGAEHAYAEGEGDRSLEFWQRVHWEVFSQECAELNREPSEDMPVVCERLRLLYPARE